MSRGALTVQFGVLIRRLRMERGLSQEEFARRCGLHRTYIGSIERGEKTVTIETADKLAKALGTDLGNLFVLLEEAERSGEVRD